MISVNGIEVSTPKEAARELASSYRAKLSPGLCEVLAEEVEYLILAFLERAK